MLARAALGAYQAAAGIVPGAVWQALTPVMASVLMQNENLEHLWCNYLLHLDVLQSANAFAAIRLRWTLCAVQCGKLSCQ
jgi:hypothetical protein